MLERGPSYLLAVIAVSLAGLFLREPVLHTGFIVDDYAQLSMMGDTYPVHRRPLALFSFTSGDASENQALKDAGFFPWWTHRELKIALFRPLASALMWLDHWWFQNNPTLFHMHSAAWWLTMSVTWGTVAREFLPPAWALAVHALCTMHPAHGMLLGWIANRNASVAMLFGLTSLWLQVRRRERRCKSDAVSIPFCWGLTLLAGEYGIGMIMYCLAYEVLGTEPAQLKWRRTRPGLVIFLSYAVLRVALDLGPKHSGMYIDPIGEPLAFLRIAGTRGPALLADLVLGLRSNWWSGGYPWAEQLANAFNLGNEWRFDLRPMRVLHAVSGVGAALIALIVVCFSQQQNPKLKFAAAAMPLSLIPVLGGTPESRLLLPALFGWSLLLAQTLIALLAKYSERRRSLTMLSLVAVCGLVAVEANASFRYSAEDRTFLPRVAGAARDSILAPTVGSALAKVEDAFLIAAVDPTTTIYIPMLRRWHGEEGPTRCHLLLNAASWFHLDRLSDTEFRLAREQKHYTALDVYAQTFNREPMQVGQVFTTQSFRATVEQVHDGLPTAVKFQTKRSLDDPTFALLAQVGSGLRVLRFPPLGGRLSIPPPAFPIELMSDQPID